MIHVGEYMSTLGDVQYIGEYHEYIRDIMTHAFYIEDPDVQNIPNVLITYPNMNRDILPMYS